MFHRPLYGKANAVVLLVLAGYLVCCLRVKLVASRAGSGVLDLCERKEGKIVMCGARCGSGAVEGRAVKRCIGAKRQGREQT